MSKKEKFEKVNAAIVHASRQLLTGRIAKK